LGTQSANSQWTVNGNNIYNSNTGNVGIGTTNPGTRLHISGSQVVDAALTIENIGTGGKGWSVISTNNSFSQGGGKLLFFRGWADGAGGTMVLDANGNVGIGMTNPMAKLDVNGGINSLGIQTHIISLTGFGDGYTAISANADALVINADAGWGEVIIGSFDDDNRCNFLINGNVGIGKTNPGAKLDIAGGVRADSIVINTGGADFVFDERYDLSSLEKVEKYINENKCLPGIAKAKTMQTEGVNVGALQTQLLQKVEELTLYLIEQNKRIKKLEEENLALQTKK
jgi:hypothetical protein